MAMSKDREPGSRVSAVLARLGRRARKARWQLAAGVAAVVIVLIAGHAPVWAGVAALLLVMLAALAGPPRPTPHTADTEAFGEAQLQALAAAELADAMPDPVITFDSQGVVAHANKSAQTAFGSIVGGMILQLRFRAPEMQDFIRQVVTTGRGRAIDYAERVPVERVFRVSAAPVGPGTGLFVLVFKDQSEARRIDRMRADFIANASHELRTPLASIAGFIETLRGPARNDAAAREKFLQIMHSQTGRMARLIDDLLSLSRLEMKPYLAARRGGRHSPDARQRHRFAAAAGPRNRRRDHQATISAEGRSRVPGDRDELFQVFENLLENACKYGQSGGRSWCRSSSGRKGPSIDSDDQVRDFGPGHRRRAHSAHHRALLPGRRRGQPRQKGTGLGLAIVKHILTRHNARLSIKSEVGKGAAFIGSFAGARTALGFHRRTVSFFCHPASVSAGIRGHACKQDPWEGIVTMQSVHIMQRL